MSSTPAAPPPQPQLTDADRAALANNLAAVAPVSYLYLSMTSLLPHLGPNTYQSYFEELLKECGQPTDPIERMMIEQVALAHHNVGRLLARAGHANALDETIAYNAAASRLAAEFRKTVLALREYRIPAQPRLHVVSPEEAPRKKQHIG